MVQLRTPLQRLATRREGPQILMKRSPMLLAKRPQLLQALRRRAQQRLVRRLLKQVAKPVVLAVAGRRLGQAAADAADAAGLLPYQRLHRQLFQRS